MRELGSEIAGFLTQNEAILVVFIGFLVNVSKLGCWLEPMA